MLQLPSSLPVELLPQLENLCSSQILSYLQKEGTIRLWLDGEPVPQRRARAGKNHFYNPSLIAKQNIRHLLGLQKLLNYPNLHLLKGIVFLQAYFFFAVPKSFSKKKRLLALNNEIFVEGNKDIDNCLKLIMDCLTGIIWEDDKQVRPVITHPFYAEEGGTLLCITPLDDK